METEVRALNFKLTSGQQSSIERCLRRALKTHTGQIGAIRVWLSEAGSFEEPLNQRCLLQVTLSDSTLVVIDVAEATLDVALQRAVDRADWKVAHCISRRQAQRQASCGIPGHAAASGMRILHLQASL